MTNYIDKLLKEWPVIEGTTSTMLCENCFEESKSVFEVENLLICDTCVEYVKRRKQLTDAANEWDETN